MLYHALATIERGAVGNHALGINAALTKKNIDVGTYSETIREEFTSTWGTMQELSSRLSGDDTVFYQFANPSPMADMLYESQCRLILNYHNVTPAHFFSKWNPATASAVSRARAQLARLAPVCSQAIAVSSYNASELVALGYKNVDVIPVVFSDEFYTTHQGGRQNIYSSWLYVGRIAPHKNLHVLLRAFELYRTYVDENAELTIVGSTDTELYGRAIDELINDRNFGESVRVIKRASSQELMDAYRSASVFVSASEHEGFCVPVIEAMTMDLPVVAVDAAALSETASSAAVLVPRAEAELIAEAVARIEKDSVLRTDLVARGHERSRKFDPRVSADSYADYLKEFA